MANAPTPNDLTRQQLDELDALLQKMLALPLAKSEGDAPPAAPAPAGWRSDPPGTRPRQPHLTDPVDVDAAPAADETFARFTPSGRPPVVSEQPPSLPVSFAPQPVASPYSPPTALATPPPAEVPVTPAVPFEPPALPEPSESMAAPAARLFSPPSADTGVPPAVGPAPAADPSLPAVYNYEAVPVTTGTRADDFGRLDLADLRQPKLAEPAETPAPAGPPPRPPVPVVLWPLFAVNWVLEAVLSLFGPPGRLLATGGMKHLLGGVGVLLVIASGLWTARGMGWVQIDLPAGLVARLAR